MYNVRHIIRTVLRESYDRPYGIAYTGAMIENEQDVARLHNVAEAELAQLGVSLDEWKQPNDYHMTVCLGELPLHRKMAGDLNSEVSLHVTHFGISDLAAAFKITGYMSKNELQHITMLFKNQPADSKNITNWHPLDAPFDVSAVIREVPAERP